MKRPRKMRRNSGAVTLLLLFVVAWGCSNRSAPQQVAVRPAVTYSLRGALLSLTQVSDERLAALKVDGCNAIVLPVSSADQAKAPALFVAASLVKSQGLSLYYWLEIARCPELADAHPEWMASLQGHDEWRRLFPETPAPRDDEVVKVYPWVPLLYQEAYTTHRQRVSDILAAAPKPDGVFLNDLQGAPSACGCGNVLCRWTADYGPIHTATAAPDDAAARFVAEVEQMVPQARVIPVWVTECEEHDVAQDGACAGVGCFRGICWTAFTEQLMPVASRSERIAVLATYQELHRDLEAYPQPAGWVGQAIRLFQTMPPAHEGRAIASERLIAILQGWELGATLVEAQIKAAGDAGTKDFVVAYEPIDQSWRPFPFRWK